MNEPLTALAQRLILARPTWTEGGIEVILKTGIEQLPSGTLPLMDGVSQGSYIDDSDLSVTVLRVETTAEALIARLGIFFTEIVASCGCGDDPVCQPAYCELLLQVDMASANIELFPAGN